MKITLKIVLFVVALGLVGCTTTSSLQKELAAGGIPKFDGYVTPINIPVLLRYKPTDFRFKASMAISIDTGRKSAQSHVEMVVKSKIRKLGNLLTHDVAFDKFVVNGKIDSLSGFTVRALTDARGTTREMELVGVELDEKGQKSLESIIDALGNTTTLPEMPVRSGDSWKVNSLSVMAEAWEYVEPPELLDLFDIEYTVDGWGVVDGRKLMITSADKTITTRIKGEDIQITQHGYQLWDVETAQKIEIRELMVMTWRNRPDLSVKILSHGTQF